MARMMKKKYLTVIVTIQAFSFTLWMDLAEAYLDPGTGSMLIQAVLAVIAAIGVSIGIFWSRFKELFRRISKRGGNETNGKQG